MNHLLVVGCGYLGQEVADCFEGQGWQVTRVSRTAAEGFSVADVSAPESLLSLRESIGTPSHIVHSASSGRGGPEAYRKVFVDGCRNLVEVFPESHLLFTSSTSVYAQQEGEVVNETSEAKPQRETGEMLLEAEGIVVANQGTVLRLAGIYGPGRSVLLKRFMLGEARVEDDGRRTVNQIHRDDAANAFWVLANSAASCGEVYNIADSTPTSQGETMRLLADYFGQPLPESVPRDLNRKRGWTHKTVSNAKALAAGWEPQWKAFIDAVPHIEKTIAL